MQLVVATHNPNKVRELSELLSGVSGIEVLGYDGPEPSEDGESFLENALTKARAAYRHTGKRSIADDSGISVAALDGKPGIDSAHWCGERDDAANRRRLLDQLKAVGDEDRQASFVCTIAMVDADAELFFTGVWPGRIAQREAGENGFGYDSIFIPDGFELTAAQLEPELKNAFSHRAMALSQLVSYLRPQ